MFSREYTVEFPKRTVFRGVEVRICRQKYTFIKSEQSAY